MKCHICNHEEAVPRGISCKECTAIWNAALQAVSRAREIGVPKYGPNTWRLANDNIEHALTHIFKYRRGDTSEDHLAHAICRLVMEYAKS